MEKFNIAIDGPSGAGKGVTSKWLAEKLNLKYLDTGAMYRAVALYFFENNIDVENFNYDLFDFNKINISFNNSGDICLDNVSVENKIRTQEIAKIASNISKLKQIRSFLEQKQKQIVKLGGFIAEGRDIGTVIIPNAKVKIYLTASVEIRAKRRFKDLKNKKIDTTFEKVLNEVILRDEQDMNRKISPLKQAEDAILVDTTNMNIYEQNDFLLDIILEKIED